MTMDTDTVTQNSIDPKNPTPLQLGEQLQLRDKNAVNDLNRTPMHLEDRLEFIGGRAEDGLVCIIQILKMMDRYEARIKVLEGLNNVGDAK